MPKAVRNGALLAESEHTEVVEENHHFPPERVKRARFKGSRENASAAWFHPAPKPAIEEIEDHVAFWRGVVVQP
jgi:uncharacterized protein (DUF427 family)